MILMSNKKILIIKLVDVLLESIIILINYLIKIYKYQNTKIFKIKYIIY